MSDERHHRLCAGLALSLTRKGPLYHKRSYPLYAAVCFFDRWRVTDLYLCYPNTRRFGVWHLKEVKFYAVNRDFYEVSEKRFFADRIRALTY